MTDSLSQELQRQIAELKREITELRTDIYSDAARRRVGILERTELMDKRQDDLQELLEALQREQEDAERELKRRDAARDKAEARRGRAVNLMFGAITTILAGFAVAALSVVFLGA